MGLGVTQFSGAGLSRPRVDKAERDRPGRHWLGRGFSLRVAADEAGRGGTGERQTGEQDHADAAVQSGNHRVSPAAMTER
jgi:hypothetical protein